MSLRRNTSIQFNATRRKLKPRNRFSRHTTRKRPLGCQRYLRWNERPQFQAHSVEHLHQASDLNLAAAPAVQQEAELDRDHSACERDLALKQRRSQIGPVLLRLRQDDLQRRADATEINLHGAEI